MAKKTLNMLNCSEIVSKWCAEDCISLDKIPYIGAFSESTDNIYVATGFNKWGITSSNIAANLITDTIMERENPYTDIFKSVRVEPIKNKDEMKNILKESINSLVGKRLEGKNTPTCKHLGCKTTWNELEKTWDCPCHGSRYDKRGIVIEGPAIENIDDIKQ